MAKFQLPASTKGGSKGFAPQRRTAAKAVAARPKARPLAPNRFQSQPAAAAASDPLGAWACLYAKKGPKKKITWLDGEVVREPYPGNMHRIKLIDADTRSLVTGTTKSASLAPFEVDKDDETCLSGYRLQITERLRGGGPVSAPAAAPAPIQQAPRAPAPAPRAPTAPPRAPAPVQQAPPRPKPAAPRQPPAPAAPSASDVGAWSCLYAKKGPKKRITWVDGEVTRETYPGNMHKFKLFDAATRVLVTGTTTPAAHPLFEIDEEDETSFSSYRLQITERLRGGLAPGPAPVQPARQAQAPAPAHRGPPQGWGATPPPVASNAPAPAPQRSGPPANWTSAAPAPQKAKAPQRHKSMHATDEPVADFVVLAAPRVALRGPVARKLRPHQREAVAFLYGCLTGRQPGGHQGAILGDEMGLGKTLTTLALLRTLVKAAGSCQNDDHSSERVRKACVVCPASLVAQWPNEDAKFFGSVSSNVTWVACVEKAGGSIDGTVETAKSALERWRALDGRRSCAVLSISYEAFARHAEALIDADPQLDLLIMDEGHRLRGGSKAKTASILRDCRATKRLLLTGTPAMNNLDEFHALVDVVCPGALGDVASFRRDVARPISAGALRGSSRPVQWKAKDAIRALRSSVAGFYLRRAASDIVRASLPPKTVHIVCCAMVAAQQEAYVEAADLKAGGALATIQQLRALATRGPAREPLHEPASGKLQVAFALLQHLRDTGNERVVIASGSTATLDVVQACCDTRRWDWLRVDGGTPPAERPRLVERFKAKTSTAFVFLLSTRAGGCGLNLVGGSRLLLLDPDWNPAHDEQAMARVWRDGQARPVHVYRLLSAGTIDEKTLARQLHKHDVNDGAVLDDDRCAARFSAEDLRKLFAYEATASELYASQARGRRAWPAYVPTALADGALRAAASHGVTYVKSDLHSAAGHAADASSPDDELDSADEQDFCQPPPRNSGSIETRTYYPGKLSPESEEEEEFRFEAAPAKKRRVIHDDDE